MRWLRRIGLGVIALLVLAAIFLASWEPLTAGRATPPPAHSYDVEIARDTFGVPHIFGTTDADVAYGIACAHAEDDFSTLQEVVAMTRGRLGAMTGADGAKTDYVLHLLGARETVDRDYDKQPADVRALLDGYAAGLNLYAEKHPGEVRLARLFPVDGKDIATGFVLRSPFFFGLEGVLGALSGDKPLPRESAGPAPDAPDVTPLGSEPGQAGSNAFVVGPRRAADGFTRLVSNSHQPWRGAAAWYELVVHSKQGWNFAGATFPGAPYPLLGHNEHLGWTNTVNRPDLIDVYKLVTDGDRYRFDGQWRPLEKKTVWLPVKLWGPFVLPVPKTVWRAVQGPVIRNKGGSFALRYGGADQLRMVEEYYRLTRAQDFAQWQKALAMQGVPGTNFLYADAAGNIAHFYNASFPNRKPGYDYAGVLPGDTSKDFAPGTVPWSMVPRNVNPKSGFLINANNSPYQAAGTGSEIPLQPVLLGVETDTTNRGTRALELMGANPSISADDLMRIKYDSGVAAEGYLGVWYKKLLAVDPRGDPLLGKAHALLAQWDWNFDGKGPADALAYSILRNPNRWHYERKPEPDPRTVLIEAATYLQTHFGRLDLPLGNLIRLQQGKVDLPLDGGPDSLRAATNYDELPDGRLAIRHGDSFIMFMAWDKAGKVRSQSVQPFGAATTRPDSPHYTDQAPLFVAHKLKPVWFDPAELKAHTERRYRP
ncbi:penicillin acylase family protein [Sphingomonas sp. R-74633]|uniref:penicillin acylase family protein n=1 Tax=Sphingomonas sp. R-74633 TaxID=2751188 RepID=UPI0015D3F3DE|nr:penicillin acylase family protein [Sphingomonas sp. R-74633]NYT42597.1 penicillin acylase family protein [Sphingomonas sp. R-74633]